MIKKILSITVFTTMGWLSIQGQSISKQLVSSSGDEFKNGIYQLDWSIGEIATESLSAENVFLTQGFHQEEISITPVGNEVLQYSNIELGPNPANDHIWLKISDEKAEEFSFIITNILGKEIFREKQISKFNYINLDSYVEGVYFVSVFNQNQIIKVFKISKVY